MSGNEQHNTTVQITYMCTMRHVSYELPLVAAVAATRGAATVEAINLSLIWWKQLCCLPLSECV